MVSISAISYDQHVIHNKRKPKFKKCVIVLSVSF